MWRESLKRMKVESGLTTAEISVKSGIPEPTLEKLFAGVTKDPKLPTMQKLVHFFGYTLDDLYGEKEKAPAPSEDSAEASLIEKEMIDRLVTLGLIEEGLQLSDADVEFLIHVSTLISMWFNKRGQSK